MFGASVLFWVGSKAKNELMKALTESDNKLSSKEKVPTFNIV